MNKFKFDTWGVRFLAVCRVPSGWRITAGGSAASDGVFEGEGSQGATWINARLGRELSNLVLLKLYGPVQKADIKSDSGVVPATFAGTANVITTAGKEDGDTVKLTSANVRLTPAMRCPPPPR